MLLDVGPSAAISVFFRAASEDAAAPMTALPFKFFQAATPLLQLGLESYDVYLDLELQYNGTYLYFCSLLTGLEHN